MTADIDLVVDLAPEQAFRAIDTLLGLGFKAHAPVNARLFADKSVRDRRQSESGMLVLSFWDPENRRPTVNLFADYPIDFEMLFNDSQLLSLASYERYTPPVPWEIRRMVGCRGATEVVVSATHSATAP